MSKYEISQTIFTIGTAIIGISAGSLIASVLGKIVYGNKYDTKIIYWKSNVFLAAVGGCVCLLFAKRYANKLLA